MTGWLSLHSGFATLLRSVSVRVLVYIIIAQECVSVIAMDLATICKLCGSNSKKNVVGFAGFNDGN